MILKVLQVNFPKDEVLGRTLNNLKAPAGTSDHHSGFQKALFFISQLLEETYLNVSESSSTSKGS